MLNLALKVRHPSAPRYGETISIWTYPIDRAEYFSCGKLPRLQGQLRSGWSTAPNSALGRRPISDGSLAHRALESGEFAAAADSGLGRGASREQAARRHSLRWPGGSRGPVELT